MKSYLVIFFLLSCSTLSIVQTEKTSNLKGIDYKSDVERSLALYLGPQLLVCREGGGGGQGEGEQERGEAEAGAHLRAED